MVRGILGWILNTSKKSKRFTVNPDRVSPCNTEFAASDEGKAIGRRIPQPKFTSEDFSGGIFQFLSKGSNNSRVSRRWIMSIYKSEMVKYSLFWAPAAAANQHCYGLWPVWKIRIKVMLSSRGRHKADVVIIGGGFTGLSSAYNIHRRFPDKKIILLEGACCSYGGSGSNGGFCVATSLIDRHLKDPDARKKT
jgi:hypothetical protein